MNGRREETGVGKREARVVRRRMGKKERRVRRRRKKERQEEETRGVPTGGCEGRGGSFSGYNKIQPMYILFMHENIYLSNSRSCNRWTWCRRRPRRDNGTS